MAVFKIGPEVIAGDDSTVIGDAIENYVIANGTASDRKWIQSRSRDMSQAVNKILKGDGTPTSEPKYHQLDVLHASAGVAARTGNISLFYIIGTSSTHGIRILGVGEHTSSASYRLRWKDKAWEKSGRAIEL